jgi:hypothetical protein
VEEKEKILKYTKIEEEHALESLTQWEMELKILEDWLDSLEPEGGCQKISISEEMCQHELQLKEAGMKPEEELVEDDLLEEIVEQQFNKDPAELESTAEWPVNVIGDEISMGD